MDRNKTRQAVKVCDLTYLENFSGGDKNFIRNMIGLFIKLVSEELENMRAQATASNFKEVKGTAHKLKSSVTLLGASGMAKLLKEIEELAGSNTCINQILQLHAELVQLNKQAIQELNEVQETL